ncbi:uncharacterized protein LOC130813711 [Amaranthus tricolor]|uniref:uncharacterized protein LOC130813711 n=1 Tax=Amaranthus tricolor TaxID=29722 RepID=UPI00258B4E99|nr:uncharacterized protein LOC130813711 [Amaranthus tricolor]
MGTNKPVKYAVVDAFTPIEFKGNPAAVCLLEEQKQDVWLQSLATEFNLSETCYLTPLSLSDSAHPRFHLRWFTPVTEVKLCGHATLAAAHYCFTYGLVKGNTVEFSTISGILTAKRVFEPKGSGSPESENVEVKQPYLIQLDFPAPAVTDCTMEETSLLSKILGHASVIDMKKTALDDLLVVLPSSEDVIDACLELEEIKKLSERGLIICAAGPSGSGFDFFSRFFAPNFGIDEDPVCGSAHCALAVYWSKKLGKCDLHAYAASPRSGTLKLQLDEQNDRVKLLGKAVTVMEGSILV